jgi:hypothetical protein
MELPNKIKNLYKHWSKHTVKPSGNSVPVNINRQVLERMILLINERNAIYEKKELGSPKPYTADSILSTYRFCNIYRELDRQTIYFHTLLRSYENDFPLWLLNMLFCRSICRPDTIEKIGLLSFDSKNNKEVFDKLVQLPSPKYGNAYIFPISLIQKTEWGTREKFFCHYLPQVLKQVAGKIDGFKNISVVDALDQLIPIFGFNLKFLLTELLIDVAYQYPDYIDLFDRFPIGPGSKPTMLMLNSQLHPEVTNHYLVGLLRSDINYMTYNNDPVYLSAENWEGVGCEFRKYNHLLNGTGRRRLYRS